MDEVLVNLVSTVKHVIGHIKIQSVIWITSIAELVSTQLIAGLASTHSLQDLRALGQTTKIERSTLAQVQARIAYLREKTKEATSAKAYDFDKRLEEVRQKERQLREQKKAEKRAEKDKARLEVIKITNDDVEMAAVMGFGGFGSSKK